MNEITQYLTSSVHLFCLAKCPLASSILSQGAGCPSSLWLKTSYLLYSFICQQTFGYFHILDIVNHTIMNVIVQIVDISYRWWFYFLWMLTQKWAVEPNGSSSFNFLRSSHIVSIMTAPIYIPSNVSFLHIFASNELLKLYNHLNSIKVIAYYGFDLRFLEHLSMYLLAVCVSSLEKCLFTSFFPF